MNSVTLEDFANSFGTTPNSFSNELKTLISNTDFRYEVYKEKERDQLLLRVLKAIADDKQLIGAEERKKVWFNGWAENLNHFSQDKSNLEALIPAFIRSNQPVRYKGQYIQPQNPNFELDFITVFRTWLFQNFFSQYGNIYEFGCGTGFNLVLLNKLLPGKSLHGLDFVQSSVDLINLIGEKQNINLKGYLFDMITPDGNFKLAENSAVFTFGAIEQLAGKFKPFIHFLLRRKPKLCAHIEPTVELYDEDALMDYLAIQFHKKRGYTEGLLPYLQELETKQRIKLIKITRLNFGSLFMEGYMLYIWKPVE